jgi:pimeloyl-ACP methyl ester carboxylesterase
MFRMRKTSNTRLATVLVALSILLAPASARAGEEAVTLKHGDLTLNGRLVLAEGKSLADGVVLLTHGTLAHNGMELIQTHQTALEEREINSLAITLGLGVDARIGMYDCATPHRHRHEDALDEIGLWLDWLKSRGAKDVTLMGHSRGGNQTAWFAAERMDPVIRHVVLVAPATWDGEKQSATYRTRHGQDLQPILDEASALVAAGKGDSLMSVPALLYCDDARASAEAFLSYYRDDPRKHTPALLKQIVVPVLVIAGSLDDVVADLPEAVAPIADGKAVRLVVIDGADHFFLDFFTEDSAEAARALIAGE